MSFHLSFIISGTCSFSKGCSIVIPSSNKAEWNWHVGVDLTHLWSLYQLSFSALSIIFGVLGVMKWMQPNDMITAFYMLIFFSQSLPTNNQEAIFLSSADMFCTWRSHFTVRWVCCSNWIKRSSLVIEPKSICICLTDCRIVSRAAADDQQHRKGQQSPFFWIGNSFIISNTILTTVTEHNFISVWFKLLPLFQLSV